MDVSWECLFGAKNQNKTKLNMKPILAIIEMLIAFAKSMEDPSRDPL